MFNYDLRLTIAAYNAGEQAVMKIWQPHPALRETLAYVPNVMKFYKRYSAAYATAECQPTSASHGIAQERRSNQSFPTYRVGPDASPDTGAANAGKSASAN